MKKKLISMIWMKEKRVAFVFVALFLIAALATDYVLLLAFGNHYRWEPMRDLSENWYYCEGIEEDSEEQVELKKNFKLISVWQFRQNECKHIGSDDFPWDDRYASGDLYEATDKQFQWLLKEFPDLKNSMKVSELVEEKYGVVHVIGVYGYVVLGLFWGFVIISGVIWFRYVLRKTHEEQKYLAYIGNSEMKVRKIFCGSFLWCVPVMWIFSFAGIIFPEEEAYSSMFFGEGPFWQIYPQVPLLMVVWCALMSVILYFIFWSMWKKKNVMGDIESGERVCLEQHTVTDNLHMILWTQGYSDRVAGNWVKEDMQRAGISFYAKRLMERCRGDDRLQFWKLQDKYLKQEEI